MSKYSRVFEDDSKYEEAEFNLAIGTIIRINEKLKEVNCYLQVGDYLNAFKAEQAIFSEVHPFIEHDKDKSLIKQEIEREIELETKLNNSYVMTKNKSRVFVPTIEIDHKLREWDRKLRSYLFKYKLYMKMLDNRLPAAKVG